MDNKKAQTTVQNGNKWTPVIVAVIGAFVGSLGTVTVYLGTPVGQKIARPDPFTGSQAAALAGRVGRTESQIEYHIDRHPDETNNFALRIAALEAQSAALVAQNGEIIRNQERILKRLNAP